MACSPLRIQRAGHLAGTALTLATSLLGCTHASHGPAPSPPGPTLRMLYGLEPLARLAPGRTALVLVDFQDEFVHGKLAIPDARRAADHAGRLLDWARRAGVTVVHVRNLARPGSPVFAPGSATAQIVPAVAPRPDELVITKSTGGAFTRTALDATLRARNIDTLVIAGIMAHLAVAMTAQDAAVHGYRVAVASDATTTRDLPGAAGAPPIDRATLLRAALAALADRFADVMPTDAILALPITGP